MFLTISYPSTQFEELYESFVNLGAHLPPKDNSPIYISEKKAENWMGQNGTIIVIKVKKNKMKWLHFLI